MKIKKALSILKKHKTSDIEFKEAINTVVKALEDFIEEYN